MRRALPWIFCILLAFAVSADEVRPPGLAGAWYSGDSNELAAFVDDLLAKAAEPADAGAPLRAVIAPHAGYPFSAATAAAVYKRVQGKAYKRVILLGPSHRGLFHGFALADWGAWETPLGRVEVDRAAVEMLRADPLVAANDEALARAEAGEHSLEIHLPLLQRALAPGWSLLPVMVGGMAEEDYARAAELLRPLADAETLVVVSSDFTHFGPLFGYQPFPADDQLSQNLAALDQGAFDKIAAGDASGLSRYLQDTGINICGYGPISILLKLVRTPFQVEKVAYQTSGAVTGDLENSVSYLALAVTAPEPFSVASPNNKAPEASASVTADQELGLGEAELRLLHKVASLGVRYGTDTKGFRFEAVERLSGQMSPPFGKEMGAFVTLKKEGQLRGCVGYVEPIAPLWRAVFENGHNAAVLDPRFSRLKPEELEGLDLEVSVLTPPRPIASLDEFQVDVHGIVLNKDGRKAVFLPEVAKGMGWSREQTLEQLSEKAGLPADAWREGAKLEVFTSLKYEAPYNGAEE